TARRHRAGHRPPQRTSPHGPQPPRPCQRRRHQRRARGCRLQLPPPDRVVESFVAQNPDRAWLNCPAQINLKSGFFTDDWRLCARLRGKYLGRGAPRATPKEIVDRLNGEINAGLADPKIRARLAELGSVPTPLSPMEFAKLLADDTE